MADDARDHGGLRLSAAAQEEWSGTVELVMRGVAHTLNNRAAALSAVIELSREPEDGDRAAIDAILRNELQRVSELAVLLRTLGPPQVSAGGPDAFTPGDAAAESRGVLQLYDGQRERAITIDASSAPPIRVPRWMFVRAIIALAVAATSREPGQATPGVIVAGDDEWVVARIDGPAHDTDELSPYVAELARAMGGEALAGGSGFRLPTLAAIRRREGR